MERLAFDENGLLPSLVQDWHDGTILMVGFMNQEAIEATFRTQRVHFWSRSKQRLWKKGETSGHELVLKNLYVDCDQDTLLIQAEPMGPTCHTGKRSCFFSVMAPEYDHDIKESTVALGGILERVYDVVLARKSHPQEGSYVSKLMRGGRDRLLKKIVEESGEVILAGKNADREEIVYEVADLWFHTLVMLGHYDISPQEVYRELGRRFGQSGLQSKEGGSPP